MNQYRALLMKCAQDMPANVHKLNLFHEFRSDKTAKAIVNKAKSILAADHTFFSPTSPRQRIKGPELHERIARIFVENILERREGSVLQLTHAYQLFCAYAQNHQLAPVKRSMFKSIVAPMIRENFDLGLRNDLAIEGNEKQLCGWKGIAALDIGVRS